MEHLLPHTHAQTNHGAPVRRTVMKHTVTIRLYIFYSRTFTWFYVHLVFIDSKTEYCIQKPNQARSKPQRAHHHSTAKKESNNWINFTDGSTALYWRLIDSRLRASSFLPLRTTTHQTQTRTTLLDSILFNFWTPCFGVSSAVIVATSTVVALSKSGQSHWTRRERIELRRTLQDWPTQQLHAILSKLAQAALNTVRIIWGTHVLRIDCLWIYKWKDRKRRPQQRIGVYSLFAVVGSSYLLY